MSFDWMEYLVLAEGLASSSGDSEAATEGRRRSAISRGYYAAFNEAKRFLENEGVSFSATAVVHLEVSGQFLSAKHPLRKRIGDNLASLRTWRNKADYWATVPRLNEEFFSQLRRARRVMTDLNALSSN